VTTASFYVVNVARLLVDAFDELADKECNLLVDVTQLFNSLT